MKTDAELLLVLLGEDCCCDCCDDQSPPPALPNRPQMFGKKMPVASVPDTDTPFVPPLYPERETPQLPQPAHTPALTTSGEYGQLAPAGEAAYTTGVLLDSGVIDPLAYALTDHQTRTLRSYDGAVGETVTFSGNGNASVAVLQGGESVTPAPAPTYRGQVVTEHLLPRGYATEAAFRAMVENRFVIVLPGVGLCIRQGVDLPGVLREEAGPSLSALREDRYRERAGVGFDGLPRPVSDDVATEQRSVLSKRRLPVLNAYSGEMMVLRDDKDYDLTVTLDQRPTSGNLRVISVYRASTPGQADGVDGTFTIVDDVPRGPLRFEAYLSPNAGNTPVIFSYDASAATSTMIGSGSGAVLSDPVRTGTYQGASVQYSVNPAGETLFVAPVTGSPLLSRPTPPYTFRSAVIGGHQLVVNGLGFDIDGAPIGGAWQSWTAFEEGGGVTLLLGDESGVLVIPGLDLARQVRAAWPDLLRDLRHAGGTPGLLATQEQHHSWPGDRGYLQLQDGGALALGPWDAYRDVPADEWRAAGLSKPRTRRAFEQGQAATPPARMPPRPPHGLALWDVYPAGGTDA